MTNTTQRRPKPSTPSEVRDRGAALLHRLRVAGIYHYNSWFVEKDPTLLGAASQQYRITMILNSRGALSDAALLEKCELIADKHLRAPMLNRA